MKKQPKVTPWFPGSVKPVWNGWYQRENSDGIFHWYWCGDFWQAGGFKSLDITYTNDRPAPDQRLSWRGLTKAAA